jgi:aspartyl-tRNA(Asn)/glutamyl-tRNA(Gln) amidotransferase subunit C
MSVTIKDVRHVAALARLGLTDETAAALTRDLNSILEHMDALAKVKTDGVADDPGVGSDAMRLRGDDIGSMPLAAKLESFAPEMREGLFLVPRLATHEDTESA